MRLARFLALIVTMAWGLWFGGLVTLFLAVTAIFNGLAPDRALGGTAAAAVFQRFEPYRLALAAVAVLASVGWRAANRSAATPKTVVTTLLILGAVVALASTFLVSAPIRDLRRRGLTDTPQFQRLHGMSMAIYTGEAALLMGAGLALPAALASSKQ